MQNPWGHTSEHSPRALGTMELMKAGFRKEGALRGSALELGTRDASL